MRSRYIDRGGPPIVDCVHTRRDSRSPVILLFVVALFSSFLVATNAATPVASAAATDGWGNPYVQPSGYCEEYGSHTVAGALYQ